jgi:ribose transport system substrate-binding protein/inositol transport system substrate-binding protein
MKMKRKSVCFVGVLFLVMMVTGCNRGNNKTAAGERKPVFMFCVEHMTNSFHKEVIEHMKKAADEADVELVISDGSFDINKQISQVESAVNQKVDVLFIEPVSMNGIMPAVEAARKAGIPVVSAIAKIADVSQASAYVGFDDAGLGQMEMERVAKDLNGKGNIALILGSYGSEAQINRSLGYKNVLDKYPDIKVVFEDAGDWSTDKGLKLAENWLQTGVELNAIVAQDDPMAMGAVKALSDKGLIKTVKTYAINAVPDTVKTIKDGALTMTLYLDLASLSQKLIDVGLKLYNGESVEKLNYIDGQILDSSNVDQYL